MVCTGPSAPHAPSPSVAWSLTYPDLPLISPKIHPSSNWGRRGSCNKPMLFSCLTPWVSATGCSHPAETQTRGLGVSRGACGDAHAVLELLRLRGGIWDRAGDERQKGSCPHPQREHPRVSLPQCLQGEVHHDGRHQDGADLPLQPGEGLLLPELLRGGDAELAQLRGRGAG